MMKSLLTSALALAALSAVGTAQQQANTPISIQRQPGHATINMATGEMTRGTQDKAATLVIVWANTDYSGWYSVGLATEEWLDWGSITTVTGSDIVGQYQFAYGTTTLDTSVGGPGVSLCTNFYNGAVGSCADSGMVPDVSFCFSGLAGSTSTAAAWGWIYTVTLTGGYEFVMPAGAFGYSMNGWDSATGPLLMYCGTATSPWNYDANGQQNVFDIYVPDLATGTCGTYWFGGPPMNIASWWLYIAKWDGMPAASCAWYCGSGTNCNGYTAGSPVLGGVWVNSVVACGGNVGALLAAYMSPLLFPSPWGEILVNIADPGGELLGMPAAFGNPAIIALPVPINLFFAGLTIYVQAVGFGGGINLHCAYSCTLGG